MNENFNLNKTPTTAKPSATRYNTLMLFTILIVLLFAFIHLYRNGLHVDIKVPSSNDAIIAKKEIPQEVMETAQKVKERLKQMNEDPTTMQQVYYYGKIIVIAAVVVGLLYVAFTYSTSGNGGDAVLANAPATNLQSAASLPQVTQLVPMSVDGSTSVPASLTQLSGRETMNLLHSIGKDTAAPIVNTLNGSGGIPITANDLVVDE